jgi:hypothetical protein
MPAPVSHYQVFLNCFSLPLIGDRDPSTQVRKNHRQIYAEILGRLCTYMPFWPCLFVACCPRQICQSRNVVWMSGLNNQDPHEKKVGTFRGVCVVTGLGWLLLPVDVIGTVLKVISIQNNAKRRKQAQLDRPIL